MFKKKSKKKLLNPSDSTLKMHTSHYNELSQESISDVQITLNIYKLKKDALKSPDGTIPLFGIFFTFIFSLFDIYNDKGPILNILLSISYILVSCVMLTYIFDVHIYKKYCLQYNSVIYACERVLSEKAQDNVS